MERATREVPSSLYLCHVYMEVSHFSFSYESNIITLHIQTKLSQHFLFYHYWLWLAPVPKESGKLEKVIRHFAKCDFLYCYLFPFNFAALTRSLVKETNIPFTVIIFILGCALGILSVLVEEVSQYTLLAEIDPHLMLHVFLPVLVFESAYALETHTLIKSFAQVVVLAVPCLREYPN